MSQCFFPARSERPQTFVEALPFDVWAIDSLSLLPAPTALLSSFSPGGTPLCTCACVPPSSVADQPSQDSFAGATPGELGVFGDSTDPVHLKEVGRSAG